MMPDVSDRGKRTGKAWVALTALAVIAAAFGIYYSLSPQEAGARRVIVRIARAVGRLPLDVRVGSRSLQPPRTDRRSSRRDQSRDTGSGPRHSHPGESLEDGAPGAEDRDRPGALESRLEVGPARSGTQTTASR